MAFIPEPHYTCYFHNQNSLGFGLDKQHCGGGGNNGHVGGYSGHSGGSVNTGSASTSSGNNEGSGITDNDNAYQLNFQHMEWMPFSYTDGFGNSWSFEVMIDNGNVLYRIDASDTSRDWNSMINDVLIYTLTHKYDAQSETFSNNENNEWGYSLELRSKGIGYAFGRMSDYDSENGFRNATGTNYFIGLGVVDPGICPNSFDTENLGIGINVIIEGNFLDIFGGKKSSNKPSWK